MIAVQSEIFVKAVKVGGVGDPKAEKENFIKYTIAGNGFKETLNLLDDWIVLIHSPGRSVNVTDGKCNFIFLTTKCIKIQGFVRIKYNSIHFLFLKHSF